MYHFFFFIIKVLSHLPFKVLYVLSDAMYYPLYYLLRYRRQIVRKNLTECFPEKSFCEILSIEKKFYHFFMDMILESSKLASITQKEIRRRMRFVNMELANGVLDEGKSVSYFIGHQCNWEWMSSVALWLNDGVVCAQVYHKLQNPYMERLMKNLRERLGNVCVDMRKTARFVANMNAAGKPYMIALIADQSPKRREIKHYTQFLNHSVPVLLGPEKMTQHYGYVPMFVATKRIKRGYYESEISLLHEHPETLGNHELTDLYFMRLEEEIRKQPECYLWTHNRFKYSQNEAK